MINSQSCDNELLIIVHIERYREQIVSCLEVCNAMEVTCMHMHYRDK